MSTPRQKCPCGYDYCGYYVDENGEVVEGVKPLEPTRQEFEKWGADTLGWRHEDFARESKQFHSGESYESPETQVAWLAWKAEGVAAPLEPLTAEDFHNSREWVEHQPQSDRECLTEDGYWLAFAEMYAAAVSRNLQQKLADADQAACRWIADAEFWRKAYEGKLAKFQELEKEIAALRETKCRR